MNSPPDTPTAEESPPASEACGAAAPTDGDRRRFQILSLDGGGIRGLYSAAVLAALEADTGVSITESFDLVAGTSTGGIIALALGAGISPSEILEFYARLGPKIFPHSRLSRTWRAVRHLFRPKHDSAVLQHALVETFGDRLLESSRLRLVVPAFNLRDREVYLFKTPHNIRYRRDGRVPMWQVAMATAAAPTYLDGCTTVDHVPLVDGGVWANNPVVVGIVEAVTNLGVSLDGVRALSLGTGDEIWSPPASLLHGGCWAWRRAAIDVALAGQSHGASAQACHLLGKSRYLRAAPLVPKGLLALDTDRLEELRSRALVDSRKLSPAFVQMFGGHQASRFTAPGNGREGGSDGSAQPRP